jgi:hypothetical protein
LTLRFQPVSSSFKPGSQDKSKPPFAQRLYQLFLCSGTVEKLYAKDLTIATGFEEAGYARYYPFPDLHVRNYCPMTHLRYFWSGCFFLAISQKTGGDGRGMA